jgi:hypothetical protein
MVNGVPCRRGSRRCWAARHCFDLCPIAAGGEQAGLGLVGDVGGDIGSVGLADPQLPRGVDVEDQQVFLAVGIDGRAEPITGSFKSRSIEAVLKLITSMKNVISWNTMSRIGVRFGRARGRATSKKT